MEDIQVQVQTLVQGHSIAQVRLTPSLYSRSCRRSNHRYIPRGTGLETGCN